MFEFSDQRPMIDAALRDQVIFGLREKPQYIATTPGLGSQSVGVWFTMPANSLSMPDEVSTVLGWPNFVIRTNMRSVGDRFFSHWRQASPTTQSSNILPGTRVLWRGVVFNTILFTSLFLGVGVVLRWRALSGRRLVIGISCVTLWFVVVIAWTCDLARQTNTVPSERTGFTDPEAFSAEVHAIAVPPPEEWTLFAGHVTTSVGCQEWSAIFASAEPSGAQRLVYRVNEMSLGWPMAALRGPSAGYWSINGDIDPAGTRFRYLARLTATDVSWPGLLVNWVMYTLAILAVIQGFASLRRSVRVRQNLCPACGYPRGASSICSECGATLPSP